MKKLKMLLSGLNRFHCVKHRESETSRYIGYVLGQLAKVDNFSNRWSYLGHFNHVFFWNNVGFLLVYHLDYSHQVAVRVYKRHNNEILNFSYLHNIVNII